MNTKHLNEKSWSGISSSSSCKTSSKREPKIRKMATSDAILAKEMYQLSLDERKQALYDLHGIAEIPQEDPEMVARALGALEEDIQNISKKDAYETAHSMSPDYVRDPKFRLKFLRANKFDHKSAAQHLVAFFEAKMELFGSDKLTKDIKLKDLSDDDLSVLDTCFLQVLRGRDSAGRAILCQFMAYQRFSHTDNLLRTIYYIFMAMAESEETQVKGIVSVAYCFGPFLNTGDMTQRYLLRSVMLRKCLPVRTAAIHICRNPDEDDTTITAIPWGLLNFVLGVTTKERRNRIRLHEGSHMECQYAIFSFGIRRDQFPLTMTGVLKREQFWEWQRDRRVIEDADLLFGAVEQPTTANDSQQGAHRQFVFVKQPLPPPISDTSFGREGTAPFKNYPAAYNLPQHQLVDAIVPHDAVISPMPNDVLFGRGKAIKEHPANIFLHSLVDERMLAYEMSLKCEKTVTASEIMAIIKERGGRFLKMEGGNWVEVDSEVAREKVSHVFRSRRRIIASSAGS